MTTESTEITVESDYPLAILFCLITSSVCLLFYYFGSKNLSKQNDALKAAKLEEENDLAVQEKIPENKQQFVDHNNKEDIHVENETDAIFAKSSSPKTFKANEKRKRFTSIAAKGSEW